MDAAENSSGDESMRASVNEVEVLKPTQEEMLCGIHEFIQRKCPLRFISTDETYDPVTAYTHLRSTRVLVIGAGGLGCEILKSLAMTGFTNIHVIDMDTVDLTNLNRQFLFRMSDIGKPKATAAAAFISKQCAHLEVHVTPHVGRIEDQSDQFYKQFSIVIAGLDSISSRQWINQKLVSFAHAGEPIQFLLDGGTEGFKGQSRLILPNPGLPMFVTACFECTISTFPPQETFPMCTIANTPRLPEHCIAYVMAETWKKHFDQAIDGDSPEDMKWVYEQSLKRAAEYKIPGVTYELTMGVVKRIVPAVASCNALIAAHLVNEAFKLVVDVGKPLNNYMMFMGDTGIYSPVIQYLPDEECTACSLGQSHSMKVSRKMALRNVLKQLSEERNPNLVAPFIFYENKCIHTAAENANENSDILEKPIEDIVGNANVLVVYDKTVPKQLNVTLEFED